MSWFRIGVLAITVCASPLPAASQPDTRTEPGPPVSRPSELSGAEAAPTATTATGDPDAPETDHRWLSIGGLAGVYGALTVWAYFAWYHDKPELPAFSYGGDGWFGEGTYAGGADKLGHAWASHAVSRLSTEVLVQGGWRRWPASLIASSLSLAFFTFVEVKDGFYYQFSPGDMAGNAAGAALSALMSNVPRVDELLDFRVAYQPSPEYRDLLGGGDVNVAEDYSGQTYQLALRLSGIRTLRRTPFLGWSRWLDVVLAYGTESYKPDPDPADGKQRSQHLYLGISVDLQQVLEDALAGRAPRLGSAGRGVFEVLMPPYATLPVVGAARSPDD